MRSRSHAVHCATATATRRHTCDIPAEKYAYLLVVYVAMELL